MRKLAQVVVELSHREWDAGVVGTRLIDSSTSQYPCGCEEVEQTGFSQPVKYRTRYLRLCQYHTSKVRIGTSRLGPYTTYYVEELETDDFPAPVRRGMRVIVRGFTDTERLPQKGGDGHEKRQAN